MDELFAIERKINRCPAAKRLAVRSQHSAPVMAALDVWMRAERACLPGAAPLAMAMDYMLKRWPSFARSLGDGRVCMSRVGDWRGGRRLRGSAVDRRLSPMPVSQFAP